MSCAWVQSPTLFSLFVRFIKRKRRVSVMNPFGVILPFLSCLVWMLWSSVSTFNCLPSLHLEFGLALRVCISLAHDYSHVIQSWLYGSFFFSLVKSLISVTFWGNTHWNICFSRLVVLDASDRRLGSSELLVILFDVKCSLINIWRIWGCDLQSHWREFAYVSKTLF